MTDVCMVIGAGAGIGGHVAKRFAREGYHAALCRRSDQEGLDRMVAEIEASGASASGHLLNAVEDGTIEDAIERIEAEAGPITTLVYNLGAQVGNRPLADTHHKMFEMGWRLGTYGLFRAAMAGRRMLCQTLNAEFAAKNIHVAHILIDSAVNAPDTLGKMLGAERFAKLQEARANGKDEIMEPDAIADTYFHVAHQHRSAWTFELDMRAFTDTAWWNHPVDF